MRVVLVMVFTCALADDCVYCQCTVSTLVVCTFVSMCSMIAWPYHLYCVQNGWTALHKACEKGHLKVAETLITAHASVNTHTKVSVYGNMITPCTHVQQG